MVLIPSPMVAATPLVSTLVGTARTMAFDSEGDLYLALREGNAIYRITSKSGTIHHLAGTGEQGYSGDGGPARAAKFAGPKGPVLAQLLGAAVLGGASANWTARGSALGGIYGRAVVVGNQTHLTIGALLLLNGGFDIGADHPAYWLLTALYVVGAAFFICLAFFSSGLREN